MFFLMRALRPIEGLMLMFEIFNINYNDSAKNDCNAHYEVARTLFLIIEYLLNILHFRDIVLEDVFYSTL